MSPHALLLRAHPFVLITTLAVSCARAPTMTTCPSDMAQIPIGGCIDRYEASAGDGTLGAADAHDTTLVAVSATGRMPLFDMTVKQAAKACRNARKHLCTEAEWLSTCRNTVKWHDMGQPPNTYSYGKVFEPRRCNDWDASNHGHAGPVLTGSFPRCVTPSGVFDMSNNVGEINATPEKAGFYAIRGGTYLLTVNDSSCEEDDNILAASGHHPTVGFRCCWSSDDVRPWYHLW